MLDIDGVLNSQDYVLKIQELFDNPSNQMDPDAVARLNRLTDQSGAVIVVSSTWRISFLHHPDGVDKAIADCLQSHGGTGQVIGTTIVTNGDRADEILDWINNHQYMIEQFVILDDDRLEAKRDSSCPYLDQHFVRTSWAHGLQDHHVLAALKIFSGEFE